MEKLLKERKQLTQLVAIPLMVVPIASTSIVRESTSPSITAKVQSADTLGELVKAMEDLSIKGQEIEKLKYQIKNL